MHTFALKQPQEGISRVPHLLNFGTVDVVFTWTCGGPHIITTICANEIKLCVYNAYVL